MIPKKIKLLLVEDSDVQRELLIHILNTCPDIEIIGFPTNGIEAIEFIKHSKPDVVLMDLHMPKMNGIDAIDHIMRSNPLPIVAMSASSTIDDIVSGFHAIGAGAVAFAEKPTSIHDPRFELMCHYLLQTVQLMSEIKVIRRMNCNKKTTSPYLPSVAKQIESRAYHQKIELIGMGVSTGGPLVLQTIFSQIAADFPPILVVQHIAPGFILGLIHWMIQITHHPISVAQDKQIPLRGHIYFAPDHSHMGIDKYGHIILSPNNSQYSLCPSVDFLFQTMASIMKDRAMGILLTGMGSDGAQQLKEMRKQGAITIAQTKETSLIYGMPGQAVAIDAASYILTPDEIANTISQLSTVKTT